MLFLILLAILATPDWVNPAAEETQIRLTRDLTLTLYPRSEADKLMVKLIDPGGKFPAKEFAIPVVFQHPNRVIRTELRKEKVWLVLCTEDTPRDSISFLMKIDPLFRDVRLVLADESGIEPRKDLLGKRRIQESNTGKSIFSKYPHGSDANTVWVRQGLIDLRRNKVVLGQWCMHCEIRISRCRGIRNPGLKPNTV